MKLTAEQLEKTPFVCDISNEGYHGGPGLSNSGISLLLDCPLRYWDKYINPDKPEREETASMRMGTMVHTFLLEPEKFEQLYYHVEAKPRKGTKAYDELAVVASGREIIGSEEMKLLRQIQRSIQAKKDARDLLKNGQAEQSIYWKDAETGVLCKARPDYMTNSYIVDLKTTRCASWAEFSKSIASYGYHRQAAMQLDAMEAISGIKHTNFINICVETERPYIVSVFVMDNDALDQGRVQYKRGLEIFKECQASNNWPDYVPELEQIGLPAWAKLKK